MHSRQDWDDALEAAQVYEFDEVDVREQAGNPLAMVFVEPYERMFDKNVVALGAAIDAAEQQFGSSWTRDQMQQMMASYIGENFIGWPDDATVIVGDDEHGFYKADVRRCVDCRGTEHLHPEGSAPFCYGCVGQTARDFRDALDKLGLFSRETHSTGIYGTFEFFNTNGSKFTATNVGNPKFQWTVTDERDITWGGGYFSSNLEQHLAACAKVVGRVKNIKL